MKKLILIIGALFTVLFVQAQCTAYFNYSFGGTPYIVQFTDSSAGTTGRHATYWDFNDGTTATGFSVTHYFNSTGTFNVCMTIYDSIAACSDTICRSVVISGSGGGCYADFTYYPDTVVPGKFHFDNWSFGASGYYWDFGDGSSSTATNPSHTFATDTFFDVVLFTLDSSGNKCDSVIQTVFTYKYRPKCLATFIAQPDTANYLKIYFWNLGSADSFSWDFGDGSTSTSFSPTHTYSKDSVYFVKLIAYDSMGLPCDSIYQSLVVDSIRGVCHADFMMSSPYPLSSGGYSVSFFNLINTPLNGLIWNFGDGSTSSQVNPTHTYASPGTYTVTLYVWQNAGTICDSMSRTLYIDSLCHASFYVARDTTSTYALYLVNNSYNLTSNTSFFWDFGDGSTSNLSNPTHTYSTFGRYQICLTVSDTAAGCYSTFCDSIGMDSNGNILKKSGFTITVVNEYQLLSVDEDLSAKTKINLYPNPSEGKVNLFLSALQPDAYQILIYNAQGVLVKQMDYNALTGDNHVLLDISDQAEGLYIVHLRSELVNKSIKLIYR